MSDDDVVAIVPMRHNSERVPGKNYRDFAGRPLFHWVVKSLIESGAVDRVVIDTDSPTIRESCEQDFPDVLVLERPEHLRAGETPMNEVLLHTIDRVPARFYVQTHSTNPLLRAATVGEAIRTLREKYPEHDSLFTVTPLFTRLWDALARPVNHNAAILLRTQDLPPIYEENSCLYVFTRDVLVHQRNRIGLRPLMWPMPAEEAVDIDEEIDFRVAEILFKEREA